MMNKRGMMIPISGNKMMMICSDYLDSYLTINCLNGKGNIVELYKSDVLSGSSPKWKPFTIPAHTIMMENTITDAQIVIECHEGSNLIGKVKVIYIHYYICIWPDSISSRLHC